MKQKPGLSRIALLNNREDSSRLALAAQVESECWQPCGAAPHSTGETDELSVITSDDCTVSIVPSIINFLLQDSHKEAEYFSWFVCLSAGLPKKVVDVLLGNILNGMPNDMKQSD